MGRKSVGATLVHRKTDFFTWQLTIWPPQPVESMGPSAPLCVPLNTLMVFCQESWCCVIWFCFYVSFFSKNQLYWLHWPFKLLALVRWVVVPFSLVCVCPFILSGRLLVVLVQFQANRLGARAAIPSGLWQARAITPTPALARGQG